MSSVDLDADSPVNLVSADEFPSGDTADLAFPYEAWIWPSWSAAADLMRT
jgi:hypothetical protein